MIVRDPTLCRQSCVSGCKPLHLCGLAVPFYIPSRPPLNPSSTDHHLHKLPRIKRVNRVTRRNITIYSNTTILDMPSSTTSNSSSSSLHSSRSSAHASSSGQRRSKAHHNLDRTAEEIEDDRTNYRILRDGGWDNIHHFMLSYGLKPYDPDDYETAKVIIQGFRERGYYRKPSGSGSSSSRR